MNIVFKKSRLKLKPANLTYSNLYGDPENEEENFINSIKTINLCATKAGLDEIETTFYNDLHKIDYDAALAKIQDAR